MQITQVEYRKLKSGHNFSNETVGAMAIVPEGHEPDDVLEELRVYVNQQLGVQEERLALASDLSQLRHQKGLLEEDVARLQQRYQNALTFLDRCGIPVPVRWSDDVPF